LTLALLAVVGVSVADLLQPWPLKIVLDNVIAGRQLPSWLTAILQAVVGDNKQSIPLFAVAAAMYRVTALAILPVGSREVPGRDGRIGHRFFCTAEIN